MKRSIPLTSLEGVTKSTDDNNHQFILHVEKEVDYRFDAKKRELRDECIKALKDSYFYLMSKSLPIYGISTDKISLESYVQTEKDVKENHRKMPSPDFRLWQEDNKNVVIAENELKRQ